MFKEGQLVKDTYYKDRETVIVDPINCIAKYSVTTPQDGIRATSFTYVKGRLQHYTDREQTIRTLISVISTCKVHVHLYTTICKNAETLQIYRNILKEAEIKLSLILK